MERENILKRTLRQDKSQNLADPRKEFADVRFKEITR